MTLLFGVGDIFYYQQDMSYRKKEQASLPPQSVYFPCFTNETFWVTSTEHDDFKSEQT
jgi:hypothetical protein